jgi:dihydropteroate synthase
MTLPVSPDYGPRLVCGPHVLDLARPRVMGIVNVTPDSFSDGGRFLDHPRALAHARALLADGADVVDVGGESTRPGAAPVGEQEELDRVLPLVEALARDGAVVSIDTMKPAVMRAAVAAGAAMINDVRALGEPGAMEVAAATNAAVCLMHMQGAPGTMQAQPRYDDVAAEVRAFLLARARSCEQAGIARDRIVLDPGFGFGKSVVHNFTLLRDLGTLVGAGYPVLAGWSRKSSLGAVTGRAVGERIAGSLAAALACVARGAKLVRVHDVRETVDALAVWQAALDPDGLRASG